MQDVKNYFIAYLFPQPPVNFDGEQLFGTLPSDMLLEIFQRSNNMVNLSCTSKRMNNKINTFAAQSVEKMKYDFLDSASEISQIETRVNDLMVAAKGVLHKPIEIERILNKLGDKQKIWPTEISIIQDWLRLNDKMTFWSILAVKLQIEGPSYGLDFNTLQEMQTKVGEFDKWCDANSERLLEINTLDLRQCNLTSIPEQLYLLTNLDSLNLGNNNLTSIPSGFDKLSKLKWLNLGDNLFSVFPKEICNSKIEALYLEDNRLISIPPEIANLQSLEILSLADNFLSSLPRQFLKIKKLENIDLKGNKFKFFPIEICNCKGLKYLNLGSNKIQRVSSHIRNLSSLEFLELSDNKLSSLCKEIGTLTSLRKLCVQNNAIKSINFAFTDLPKLTILDLNNNLLKVLPCGEERLKRLERLELRGNPIYWVPNQVFNPNLVSLSGDGFISLQKLYVDIATYSSNAVKAIIENENEQVQRNQALGLPHDI